MWFLLSVGHLVVILGSHFRGKKCDQTKGQETNLSSICRTSRFILSSNEKLYVTFAHLLVQKGIFLERLCANMLGKVLCQSLFLLYVLLRLPWLIRGHSTEKI